MKRISRLLLAGLLLSLSVANAQTVVFSDNFDDGDVSDWLKSTNHTGVSAVTVRDDSFVSASYALWTYFDAPPGGTDLWVTATNTFVAPTFGDYVLSLSAKSTACDVCTLAYEVFVDGVRIDSRVAPTDFEARSYLISSLSAGGHTIGLGVSTDIAFAGRFNATFDDVVITSQVPEPETYAMLLAGLGLLGWHARRRKFKLAA